MIITKTKYQNRIQEVLEKGFITGKQYAGAKIYKEILKGETMDKIKLLCHDLMHKETINT